MFESVDRKMDGRRLEFHPISSAGTFSSDELKIERHMHTTVKFHEYSIRFRSNHVNCN